MPFKEPLLPKDDVEKPVASEEGEETTGEIEINKPAGDNSVVEKSSLSEAEKEVLRKENYYFSQKAAWEEFQKIGMDPKEAEEWFNAKYAKYKGEDGAEGTPILLRDSSGRPLGEFKFEEISSQEKAAHSFGMLKLIRDNYNLEFIKHFFNEPELLAFADKELSTLPRLVKLYKENLDKLGGE